MKIDVLYIIFFSLSVVILASDLLHFAEFLHLVDVVGEEEHQVFLLVLHYLLLVAFAQDDVGVDQYWHFAANVIKVFDNLLDHAEVESLLALAS